MDSDEDKIVEDDYLLQQTLKLRNYQIKISEIAKKQNAIVFLPAGAGKTRIATSVLCSRTQDVKPPFTSGGKRVFFLQNTKVMVHQTHNILTTQTKFKVGFYTGDMSVDFWDKNKWLVEFEKYHVLVMTGEIFRQIYQMKFINSANISLIIFDECHHAVRDHPYNAVLKIISNADPSEAPLILGLSAVLLNSNTKQKEVSSFVQSLEAAFKAKVIGNSDMEEISSFSANPKDEIVVYKKNSYPSYVVAVIELYKKAENLLDQLLLKSPLSSNIPEGASDYKNRNKNRIFRNGLVAARTLLEELGPYCGSVAALYHIILFEKYRLLTDSSTEASVLIYVKTELNKARRLLMKVMGAEESCDLIYEFSSTKVQELIKIIRWSNKNSCEKKKGTIVFVKKRATAVILAFLLKRLAATGEDFSSLKPDFVVGSSVFAKENIFMKDKSEDVIKKFASGNLNVLVATNVLEEGVDLSACSRVVNFDFPVSYSSFYQSRGRARNKDSIYYVFVQEDEEDNKKNVLSQYKELEEELVQVVADEYGREIENEAASDELSEVVTLTKGSEKIEIDGITAIKAVFRYCAKLPQDQFSQLCPIVWHKEKDGGRQAFLQLPIVSPLREIIEGDVKRNSKLAKRSVFLKTIKLLYDLHEIDEELNQILVESLEINGKDIFTHYKNEEIDKSLPQPGTKKRKQNYKIKFPEWLVECLPSPGIKTYLHVINFSLAFEKTDLEFKAFLCDLLRMSCSYAILSTKRLPKICQFPLFLNVGQVNCDFLVNNEELTFTQSELNDIKLFHFALFKKVMKISKNAQVFDIRNKENSFFIVPVDKNEENRFVINWDLIRCDFCKDSLSAVVGYNPSSIRGIKKKFQENKKSNAIDIADRTIDEQMTSNSLVPSPSFDQRPRYCALRQQGAEESREPNFTMTETYYKYFVISPNYRGYDPPQCYVVAKVCHDMTPFSPFPKLTFKDYFTYYKKKYDIEITNPNQPLLKVTPIFQCLNFNRPSLQPGTGVQRSRDKFKEHEEHLIPELCDVYPFINKYWVKANMLPTFLNRISHIYCVEEFRRKLVEESGLGLSELPEGVSWQPLKLDQKCFDKEDDPPSCISLSYSDMKSSLPLSELRNKSCRENYTDIKDPERHMFEVGLCDLEYLINILNEIDEKKEYDVCSRFEKNVEIAKLKSLRDIEIPKLIFTLGGSEWGPELAELVKVGTASAANDIVNYERLEILGDSFLKFAAVLFLFRNSPDNEGVLAPLKDKLVGNRNLMYCGSARNIQDIINVIDFVPLSDWNPPLLVIPDRLVRGIISNKVDPAVIYRFHIPHEEQYAGLVSENTFLENEKILRDYEKWCEQPNSSFLPCRVIQDKTVADCVEALLGAYLEALGLSGAFDCLVWLGVLPEVKGSFTELMGRPYHAELFQTGTETSVTEILGEVFYSDLEDTIDYHFNNKALLLEALTHPSYPKNRVTNCYQRFEFLGDAILDFLITCHVYGNHSHLTPGQVSDIRSALLNNITLACLTVRYELHKYLLTFSTSLEKAIGNFVQHQIGRNHAVDENVWILSEENCCTTAESIAVPKALGDVFESIAGAIFLDSGNSLDTVWSVYYKLMKQEIEEFVKAPPKNSLRLLQEICGDKPYYEMVKSDEKVTLACSVYYKNEVIQTFGSGPNKKEAKRSAAKLLLTKILEMNNG